MSLLEYALKLQDFTFFRWQVVKGLFVYGRPDCVKFLKINTLSSRTLFDLEFHDLTFTGCMDTTLFSFIKKVELLHAESSGVKCRVFILPDSYRLPFSTAASPRVCAFMLMDRQILRFASAPWMAVFNSLVRCSEILSGAALWYGGSVTLTSVAEIARSW